MDVLMLYHRLPYPPNKGEKFRAYPQVVRLAAQHRVWLASFVDTEEDCNYLSELEKLCHRFEAVPLSKRVALSRGGWNILRGKTLTEGYYGSRAMWRVIQDWNLSTFFDVGFAFSSSMAPYIEDLPVGRRVLDMTDLDSHKWRDYAAKSAWPISAMFRTEARRLAERELELIRKFDLTFLSNERECNRVTNPSLRSRVETFCTPMLLETYESAWGVDRDQVVGYVGTMDYRPNVEAVLWFAEHVWPAVADRHPGAEWWIVGRNPAGAVRRLDGRQRIVVAGGVDDVRRYLKRMRVFISPVQAELGVQSKVLEALAAGRPTVVSTQAHKGIGAADGEEYVVARSADAFVHAIGELLDDHARCESLAGRAIEFIRHNYDAPVLMPRFEELLLGDAKQLKAERDRSGSVKSFRSGGGMS